MAKDEYFKPINDNGQNISAQIASDTSSSFDSFRGMKLHLVALATLIAFSCFFYWTYISKINKNLALFNSILVEKVQNSQVSSLTTQYENKQVVNYDFDRLRQIAPKGTKVVVLDAELNTLLRYKGSLKELWDPSLKPSFAEQIEKKDFSFLSIFSTKLLYEFKIDQNVIIVQKSLFLEAVFFGGFLILLVGSVFVRFCSKSEEQEKYFGIANIMDEKIWSGFSHVSSCGFWVYSLDDTNEIVWSPSMYEMLDLDNNSQIDKNTVMSMVHKDSRAQLEKLFFDKTSYREMFVGRTDLVSFHNADGTTKWLQLSSKADYMSTDKIRVLVTVVNIDNLYAKLVDYRSNSVNLQKAIDLCPFSLAIWSKGNELVCYNKKFRELHGLSVSVAKEISCYSDLLSLSTLNFSDTKQTGKVETRHGFSIYDLVKADATLLRVYEKKCNNGSLISIVWEQGTDSCNASHYLNAEINSKQNLNAGKNDVVGSNVDTTFLPTMSHELLTPLNSIIGFSDLIEKEIFGELPNERYKEYASNIKNCGLRLYTTFFDFLLLCEAGSGKVKLKAAYIEPRELVVKALDSLSAFINCDSSRVKVISDKLPPVVADEDSFISIIRHTVDNALKFSQNRQDVEVHLRHDANNLLVTVSDGGVGISRSRIPEITRPFHFGSRYVRDEGTGPGLGLALVATLVNLHGGNLRIESSPGKGTRVYITLPLCPSTPWNLEPSWQNMKTQIVRRQKIVDYPRYNYIMAKQNGKR